jgi:hypothetical protein
MADASSSRDEPFVVLGQQPPSKPFARLGQQPPSKPFARLGQQPPRKPFAVLRRLLTGVSDAPPSNEVSNSAQR